MAEKAKVAIFISGRGSNMAALLYASLIDDCPYEVCLVAANDPEAEGLSIAAAEGVPTYALSHKGMPRADHDAAMEKAARDAGAQYIVLAGYMRILTEGFVGRWRGRMLNIHPSLLPKYTGLDTHARAIEAGDSHGGVSVHLVTEELDAGEVLGQVAVAIRDGETPDTLAERVRFAEHQLYPQVLARYVARESDPDFLLERVRDLALALPQSHERESHGSPGWRAGSEKSGKYFAYFNDQHHGSEHIALLVKTGSLDELLNLVETQPDTYFKPAYYGASGWVGLILNRPDCDWDHVAEWLERSWRAVAPKSATKLMDAADKF
ncbi:phosphoribosylglycinamide formyltransferase [Qipengyuania nanhaisediminis]|uniref:Phosphoribosylglycinamide formyltransferase n=1 Tax=Qipengyuania nanhaisediminis TaxID=604088 RepID=A0A1I5NT76_9SPHN|nr:phosphoribosylglycinamide formyltransferase [Qipengyuania nanhaisediminis]SFP25015.1 phosphoribosylglycinamide formyltransferase-1 [Qipengyuania nanhaisediminis]